MALFVRKQDNENFLIKNIRQYPIAASDDEGFTKLIVGLGNVGKEYEGTRHNSGFAAVDSYHKEKGFPKWQEKAKFKAYVSEDFISGKKVILAKPTTLYNTSGESVRALKDFYKIENKDIIIIHDELDLPFGTVKEKIGGGSAGSNGLKSIISQIGADFKRIRIGIKNDSLEIIEPADFVLAKFKVDEKKQFSKLFQTVSGKI